MKVLFATTNPAKIKKYYDGLLKQGIELITIKDIDINIKVDENGNTAIENACIKAKTYYDLTGIPTIGMDNNLFIDDLPEEKQPGTYVRRVNGKELSDEEMIEYYTNLVKQQGGKVSAKWVYGMAIYSKNGVKTYTWNKEDFYLLDTPSKNRNPGYPLDSIALIPKYNKYLVDLSVDEKKENNISSSKDDRVIEFIVNSLKNIEG